MVSLINLLSSTLQIPQGLGVWEDIIRWFYGFIGDYGFTIIIIAVLLKVIMLPLDYFQRKSTAKMQANQARIQPQLQKLQEKYKEHPDDMEILKQLAAALSEAGKRQQALDLLFEAFKKDTGNAQVKQLIIDILNTMQGDPLQSKYRRNLYTLMY